jgi:hypothetical protein
LHRLQRFLSIPRFQNLESLSRQRYAEEAAYRRVIIHYQNKFVHFQSILNLFSPER